jgi:hypothetical protein
MSSVTPSVSADAPLLPPLLRAMVVRSRASSSRPAQTRSDPRSSSSAATRWRPGSLVEKVGGGELVEEAMEVGGGRMIGERGGGGDVVPNMRTTLEESANLYSGCGGTHYENHAVSTCALEFCHVIACVVYLELTYLVQRHNSIEKINYDKSCMQYRP